jgi:hypothetical protein
VERAGAAAPVATSSAHQHGLTPSIEPGPDPSPNGTSARRYRVLVSLLLLLHLGSVGAHLLPQSEDGLAGLPAFMRGPVQVVSSAYLRVAWPVAHRYLDLTATRQNWRLFAPDPVDWDVKVHAIAFWKIGPDSADFVADTVRLPAGGEVPYPHLVRRRETRVLFNLGYEGAGEAYRPFYADWLCRTLPRRDGAGPSGLKLVAYWRPVVAPWSPPPENDRAEQSLGGFTCPAKEATGP